MSALNRTTGMIYLESCKEMCDLREEQIGIHEDLKNYDKLIKTIVDNISKDVREETDEQRLKYLKWDIKHLTKDMKGLRKMLQYVAKEKI